MRNKTLVASAEVTITLTLHSLGSWGEECQVSQILRQAEEAALTRAHKVLTPGTKCNIKVGPILIQE